MIPPATDGDVLIAATRTHAVKENLSENVPSLLVEMAQVTSSSQQLSIPTRMEGSVLSMADTASEGVVDHTEKNYESILIVKYKGHGSQEHARKQAAVIKRFLEVKLHSSDVEVWLVEPNGELCVTLTAVEVTWDALVGEAGE